MLSDPLFESPREAAVKSPIRAGFSVPVIDQNGNCLPLKRLSAIRLGRK